MFLYVENRFNPSPGMVLVRKPAEFADVRFIASDVAPLYFLPRNLEEFRAQKSSKYWYNIRRGEKKFSEEVGTLQFRFLVEGDEIRKWMPRVRDVFLDRRGGGYTSSEWKTEEGFRKYEEALLGLAGEGGASLAVLFRDEELLAFSYNLMTRDVFYFYQHAINPEPAYAKYSLGKVFLIRLLSHVIESGKYRLFDFMVGEAPYKMEWASCVQNIYSRVDRRRFISRTAFLCAYGCEFFYQKVLRSRPVKNLFLSALAWVGRIRTVKGRTK